MVSTGGVIMYSVKNQEMTKLKVALLMLAVSMVGVAGIMSIDTFKRNHYSDSARFSHNNHTISIETACFAFFLVFCLFAFICGISHIFSSRNSALERHRFAHSRNWTRERQMDHYDRSYSNYRPRFLIWINIVKTWIWNACKKRKKKSKNQFGTFSGKTSKFSKFDSWPAVHNFHIFN